MKSLLWVLLCAVPFLSSAQGKIKISGYVYDASTGERLIGASVFEKTNKKGTATNTYGFYTLLLPSTQGISVSINYIGFKGLEIPLDQNKDTLINVNLQPLPLHLNEVQISGSPENLSSTEFNLIKLSPKEIKAIPMLMGEVDVLKAAILLPGIQGGKEGSNDLHVRGGGPDQNLLLLDGVPVYNANHLLGFISVFNADAIQNVSIYKGGFPARYGGRLSSVIDINLKEGNNQKLSGEGAIGILSSKLLLEGPIKNENTTFLISARRTYFDAFAVMAMALASANINTYNFHDITGKVSHKFSEKDKIFFSIYNGRDKFITNFSRGNFLSSFNLKWANTTAALRWNHLFANNLFGNFSLTFSDYNFNVGNSNASQMPNYNFSSDVRYQSTIHDYGFKSDFDYAPHPKHSMKFGNSITYHSFRPNLIGLNRKENNVVTRDAVFNNAVIPAVETGVYMEDEIELHKNHRVSAGLHFASFHVRNTNYSSVQPRFSTSHLLSTVSSLKFSYASMVQHIHLLSNTGVGMPTDIWVPATDKIKPQQSWIASTGYFHHLFNGLFEFSTEVYYKQMYNVLEFTEGTDFLKDGPETNFLTEINNDWKERVSAGRGWAYGSEFMLRKKTGATTGWIAYTLAWANRQFDNINNGNPFPYIYDRRHDFSIVLNHDLSPKIKLSSTWVYNSGYRVTVPVASYLPYHRPEDIEQNHSGFVQLIDYIGERNNYKLPDYHRLDLGISFFKQKKRALREWNISVYNAYNRRNPFIVFISGERSMITSSLPQKRELNQLTIFTLIPSVSYRYKF